MGFTQQITRETHFLWGIIIAYRKADPPKGYQVNQPSNPRGYTEVISQRIVGVGSLRCFCFSRW